MRVASELLDAFTDGVFAVPLALLTDHDGAIAAIGRSLDSETDSPATLSKLCAALSNANVLLVVDNCEHLPKVATIVAELLRQSRTGVNP